DRISGRTGGADDPQRCPDKSKLVHPGVDQRLGIDILDVPDPAPGLHLGVAGHGVSILVATRLSIIRGGVSASHCDVLGRHILASANAESGFSLAPDGAGRGALLGGHRLVFVVAPGVALTGMKEYTVS